MVRPVKPASLSQTHRYNKNQLDNMDKIEREFSKYYDNITTVPEVIETDPIAVQYYNFIVTNMLQAGLPISNIDIPMLTEASFALSIIYNARKDIIINGTVEERYDKNGNFTGSAIRAIVRVESQYSEAYRKIANKLGLEPSARAAIARAQIIDMDEQDDGLFD